MPYAAATSAQAPAMLPPAAPEREERLLVLPKHRLLVCLADTAHAPLVRGLFADLSGVADAGALSPSAYGLDSADLLALIESPHWVKAAFVSHPLATLRLAAANCSSAPSAAVRAPPAPIIYRVPSPRSPRPVRSPRRSHWHSTPPRPHSPAPRSALGPRSTSCES